MKGKLPVIVALVMAIVAVFAVKSYITGVQQRANERLRGKKYAAAKINLAPGMEIDSSMIKGKEVPAPFVPPQAILATPDNANLLVGQKVRVPVKAEQLILWTDLTEERRGGFESIIPAGERAFTVEMAGGIKGSLIQPSDHVDILASFALPDDRKQQPDKTGTASWRARSDMVNIVLLQNVTVLAVGGLYVGESDQAGSPEELTLAVTLPEAQLLMFASQHGDLAAVLRRHDDVKALGRDEMPRVTFEELEKLVGNLDLQRSHRIIEVLSGGKLEEVTVENTDIP